MNYDAAMKLPEGKSCEDCVHGARCEALFGAITNIFTQCDFYPSRFKEHTPTPKESPDAS